VALVSYTIHWSQLTSRLTGFAVNQETPLGQEDDEIQGLTQVVAESLGKGEDPQVVAQQLIDTGWEPDQANGFVGSIHQQMFEAQGSGESRESNGWLLWIGAILGINFLSWLFNWGFWIY
jgi:hypothetical protein